MDRTECPKNSDLTNYAIGELAADSAEAIERHLHSCQKCAETMSVLESSTDGFIEILRNEGCVEHLAALSEPQFQLAVDAICRREFSCSTAADQLTEPQQRRNAGLHEFQPGHRLGQYELKNIVGHGGMGVVYAAKHLKLNRIVALKVLPQSLVRHAANVERFEREMLAIGQLDHPNIVRALDAAEVNGVHYLVMELVEGRTLSAMLKVSGPLSVVEACNCARQAAIGLQQIHSFGMVHRDLKPGNLMIKADGQVKILDLGLALLTQPSRLDENLNNRQSDASELTDTGQVMGTLDYMAPEQAGDTHTVDIRADIYSLGATLYAMLCGRAPLAVDRHATLIQKVAALSAGVVVPISQLRPDMPEELSDVVMKMLARSPSDRFSTPVEVVDALSRFCDEGFQSKVHSPSDEVTCPPAGDVVAQAVTSTLGAQRPAASSVTWRHNGMVIGAVAIASMAALFASKHSPTKTADRQNKADAAANSAVAMQPPNRVPITNRDIAKRVIEIGGTLTILDSVNGKQENVREIPEVDFALEGIHFPNVSIDISSAEMEIWSNSQTLLGVHVPMHRNLEAAHLRALSRIRNLYYVTLGTEKQSDITEDDWAAFVSKRSDLSNLHLTNFPVTGEFIKAIPHPEKLRYVCFTGKDELVPVPMLPALSILGIQQLRRATNISFLGVAHGSFTAEHFAELKKLGSLEHLHLITCGAIESSYFDDAGELTRLRTLNLCACNVNDAHVPGLADWTWIEELYITGNQITESGVLQLRQALPNCLIDSDFGRFEPAPKPASELPAEAAN